MHRSRVSATAALLLLTATAAFPHQRDTAVDVRPVAELAALSSDFNGDGVEDRVFGVPGDTTSEWWWSGAVNVLYSPGPNGTKPASQYFHTQSPFMKRLLKLYPTGLGQEIASADFDRDGYADLAMSVPGFDEPDESDPRINVGAVVVVYGTAAGLDPNAAQEAEVWSQDTAGVQGVSEDDDNFGSALTVGDFDGDQFLDLAVGISGEQTGPDARNSGAVTLLFGGRGGLTPRDQVVDQDTRGIIDESETGDRAGDSLAAGDFNDDGVDDLAFGVFSEDVADRRNVGAVNVIYGTRDVGLTGRGDRFVNQHVESVPGAPRRGDYFGATFTVGDHNGDGCDDLVVGAPDDRIDGIEDSGSATFIPGSGSGLDLTGSRMFTLADFDSDFGHARFGAGLASGDVNGDGYDELVVGSPWYQSRPGRVDVLAGTPEGPSVTAHQVITPDQLARRELEPGFETFGLALQMGTFDVEPGDDLLVGMGLAALTVDGGRIEGAGAAALVFSRDGRLDVNDHQLYHQGAPGVSGVPHRYEQFGTALPGSANYVG